VHFTGRHEWLTEDGDVIIAVEGDMVFVSESFDEVTADKLRTAVLPLTKTASAP